MILAHKICLDPTDKQSTYFTKACGTARFAYNWALNRWKKLYESGESVTESKLRKELKTIKRSEYPWMMEVIKCAPQLAIKDLGKAFQNFFAKRAEFPQFKKKGKKDSFGLSNDQFSIKNKTIRIPNLGFVRLTERLHARISNIRNDQTHKLTSMLAEKFGVIGIEDLNVSGMTKNHKLARAVLDMSFFEFRRQIEYKSKMKGGHVILADRFYPSSKICSKCGYKYDELNLSMREWTCSSCGATHDRDINAAVNLRNYAVSYTVSACGELVDSITSMKQELNSTNQV